MPAPSNGVPHGEWKAKGSYSRIPRGNGLFPAPPIPFPGGNVIG